MAAGFFGTAAGIVVGSLLCLGALLLAIAAIVVLSIISVFTPNSSVQGSGDEFRINAVLLKTLYANDSNAQPYYFYNGNIAENPQLSALCATFYKSLGEQNVAGCVVENGRGWGPPVNTSTSSKRRRRAFDQRALLSLFDIRVFYSTTCGVKGDQGKYSSSNLTSTISTCVQSRLNACNNLYNNSGGTFVQWNPVPATLAFSIVETTLSNYVTLGIQQVYGVRSTTANALATSPPLSFTNGTILTQLALGCQYIGSITQTQIAAAIAAQSTVSATLPSSTQSVG